MFHTLEDPMMVLPSSTAHSRVMICVVVNLFCIATFFHWLRTNLAGGKGESSPYL